MKLWIKSFILGMAAGAVFSDGCSLVISSICVVTMGFLNAYWAGKSHKLQ